MLLLQIGPPDAQTLQSTDSLINFLFKAQVIDSGIDNIISAVTVIATLLAAIFYFCNLGFNYAVTALKSLKDTNAKFFFDYEELARTLVLVACILIYPAIAHTLEAGMDGINSMSSGDITMLNNYESLVAAQSNALLKQADKESNDSLLLATGAKDAKLSPYLKQWAMTETNSNAEQSANSSTPNAQPQKQNELNFWDQFLYYINPVNWVNICISALVALICQLIKVIIAMITLNVLKVLFCIGPAFAFSILPPFKNNVTTWFATVLNTGFVFTTMHILDGVYYETLFYANKNVIKNSSAGLQSIATTTAMGVTLIVLYLMSFWLTSKYVGRGDAGRVLGKAVGMATAVVGGAMMAEGASAASNIANVTHSANDAISGGK